MKAKNNPDVEAMEKEAKYQIITLEEEAGSSDEKRKILREINEELMRLYEEFKHWLELNSNPDTIDPRIARLKEDTQALLDKAKHKLQELRENEELQAKFAYGKEKVVETSVKVASYVSEGVQEILQQDNVQRVVDNVSDTIDTIRKDERVIDGVKKLKRGTLKVAKSTYEGLKKLLDEETATDDEKQ